MPGPVRDLVFGFSAAVYLPVQQESSSLARATAQVAETHSATSIYRAGNAATTKNGETTGLQTGLVFDAKRIAKEIYDMGEGYFWGTDEDGIYASLKPLKYVERRAVATEYLAHNRLGLLYAMGSEMSGTDLWRVEDLFRFEDPEKPETHIRPSKELAEDLAAMNFNASEGAYFLLPVFSYTEEDRLFQLATHSQQSGLLAAVNDSYLATQKHGLVWMYNDELSGAELQRLREPTSTLQEWAAFPTVGATAIAGSQVSKRPQISFADKNGAPFAIDVEVASTVQAQQQGLMFRDSLPENGGMLFIYSQDEERAFWMKNTRIPLDMIHLDASRKIVGIVANAPPAPSTVPDTDLPRYPTGARSRYVLEVNGGFSARHGLKLGDQLNFQGIN